MFRENEFADAKELKAFFNKSMLGLLTQSFNADCKLADVKLENTGTRKSDSYYVAKAIVRFDRRYLTMSMAFFRQFNKPGYYLYTITFDAWTSAGSVSTTISLKGGEDLSTAIPDSIKSGMKTLSRIMVKAANARVLRGEWSPEEGEKIHREAMEFMLLPAKQPPATNIGESVTPQVNAFRENLFQSDQELSDFFNYEFGKPCVDIFEYKHHYFSKIETTGMASKVFPVYEVDINMPSTKEAGGFISVKMEVHGNDNDGYHVNRVVVYVSTTEMGGNNGQFFLEREEDIISGYHKGMWGLLDRWSRERMQKTLSREQTMGVSYEETRAKIMQMRLLIKKP